MSPTIKCFILRWNHLCFRQHLQWLGYARYYVVSFAFSISRLLFQRRRRMPHRMTSMLSRNRNSNLSSMTKQQFNFTKGSSEYFYSTAHVSWLKLFLLFIDLIFTRTRQRKMTATQRLKVKSKQLDGEDNSNSFSNSNNLPLSLMFRFTPLLFLFIQVVACTFVFDAREKFIFWNPQFLLHYCLLYL